MSLDGVSTGRPVRFINIRGYRAYIVRMRVRIASGSMDAKRRRDMRQYLRSLEHCLAICEDWIVDRESVEPDDQLSWATSALEEAGIVLHGSEPVAVPEPEVDFELGEDPCPVEDPELTEGLEPEDSWLMEDPEFTEGPEPVEDPWSAEEPESVEEPKLAEEPEPVVDAPDPGTDLSGDTGTGPVHRLFTEGPVPDAMMAALSAKLPLLCGIFGISLELSREEQLLRIVWLMSFCGRRFVCSPAQKDPDLYEFRPLLPEEWTAEAVSLWDGHMCCVVNDLVKAAMLG